MLILLFLAIERLDISDFLSLAENAFLLDVRSPAEYNHAHIPGAISLPLFTNEERSIVGTAYKQQSREQAIKIGLDFFGPKMRRMVEEVEELVKGRESGVKSLDSKISDSELRSRNSVLLYCWRGGMRSGAVAWLLNLYGFNVKVLTGGYKSFRRWVLESFTYPYPLKVLGGFTGSGKTELLQALKVRGKKIIDLEALAQHKGSAFGNIGMPPQPSQEMFENLLSYELRTILYEKEKVVSSSPSTGGGQGEAIWIEDESQRIGNINIPNAFWETMRQAPLFFLDIDFEERLQHIVREYSTCSEERMIDAIQRISKRLGGLETKNAIRFLQEKNTVESFRILLHYYDKQYLKALHNRQHVSALLTTIKCPKVDVTNIRLLLSEKPTT
ncbi:MAG: tRNA 2-selenouridine(34) synthase MnmH [Flavisolibacter sp.]|nr:tRNA 2-selenouridine(34) synthase MnmH [Flavisolibacter sp.]